MNAFSNYLETSILNHVLRGIAYQKPASLYFALFTANPGDGGNDNEVTGAGYSRVEMANNKVNFPQCAASGTPTKTNGESILFPTATGIWGTITHWAAYDAPSALTVPGTTSVSSPTITAIVSTANLRVGMTVTGSGIPASSVIISLTLNSITINNNATAAANINVTVSPKMVVHGTLATKRYVKSGKTPKIQAESLNLTLPQAPAGGFTDYLQRKVLDHVFGHLVYPAPGSIYVGLGLTLNDDDLDEWDDGAYSRQVCAFDAPVNGICANTAALSFTGVDGVSDGPAVLRVTGIWDDDNAGRLLIAGNLRKNLSVVDTNLVRFLAGQFTVTLQ